MSYEKLRAEYEAVRIGPLLWARLLDVCQRVARNYPPDVYNQGAPWAAEGYENLAQTVVLERLLEENQLDYVFDTATDEVSLMRLLAHQVKRVLAHQKAMTVVDRIAPRIVALAEASDLFVTRSLGRETWIGTPETEPTLRTLTETELNRAADLISSVPRIPSNPLSSRESMVYKAGELAEVVGRLTAELGWVAMSDIRKILDILLTAWLPTVLHDYQEGQIPASSVNLELERRQMNTLIDNVMAALEDHHCVILLGKSQDVSDGDLASRLGRSRPWVADRKTEVKTRIADGLISQLPDALHAEAMRELIDRASLAVERLP